MSQLQKPFTNAPSVARLRPDRFIIAGLVVAAIAFAFVAGTFVGGGLQSSSVVAAPRAITRDVTDGWMARYLPSAQRPRDVTDGWMARYLPSAQRPDVTDGWMARYLPSAQGN
ncbi:MAG TPA: hypothetical protein VHK63_04040 [Candidatus Limnocylindria bacterium]|nr:hypothetical protein [Candidatus Limnocylindria bacterium]